MTTEQNKRLKEITNDIIKFSKQFIELYKTPTDADTALNAMAIIFNLHSLEMERQIIVSTPIPKYPKGGVVSKDTAMVSEHGNEMVINPNWNMEFIPGGFVINPNIKPLTFDEKADFVKAFRDASKLHEVSVVGLDNTCAHDWDFDPKYYGYCPQPRICKKCGHWDAHGYNGSRFHL